ncbi:MAG: hypothetical protein JWN38_238 [Candidatus Saccharibacteria bacterium]|nr:hypothetical protein [Candidatus Saccharibacteria bacterium]
MRKIFSAIQFSGLSLAMTLAFGGLASAHVIVQPEEVTTGTEQTFVVTVPTEKNVATTGLRLEIPSGLKNVSPNVKGGWQITTKTSGSGETATVSEIDWSGGDIEPGLHDQFAFSAQTPAGETALDWKAYQTYADGSVISWDQAGGETTKETATSGPYSTTSVVSETADAKTLAEADQTALKAQSRANSAYIIGLASVVVGLAAIFLATRKD